MAMLDDRDIFHPRRAVPRGCATCPLATGSLERRVGQVVKGKTFDLRNYDAVVDAVELILRACGATVVRGPVK